MPVKPFRDGHSQVGLASTKGDLLQNDILTRDFLQKLYSTRRAIITGVNDAANTPILDNDLIAFWRSLCDHDSLSGYVDGRIISRLIPSQCAGGILTGALCQFGSVLTLAKTGGSHIAMPGGAVNIGGAVGNVRVNTALTSGLIVLAAFYLPDITDTTTTMQVFARAANSDAEAIIASYAYGGTFKTISRTGSSDTDDSTGLTDGSNRQKGNINVIAMKVTNATTGAVCINGQYQAVTFAAASQAFAGTYAGFRTTPNTVATQVRYFEVLKV